MARDQGLPLAGNNPVAVNAAPTDPASPATESGARRSGPKPSDPPRSGPRYSVPPPTASARSAKLRLPGGVTADAQADRGILVVKRNGFGRLFRTVIRPRSIRGKLIRILCVSIALVLLLLGFLIAAQVTTFRNASQTTRIVTVALSVQQAVHQLQMERGLTNGLLSGDSAFEPQLTAQRPQTDDALSQLNRVINTPANADAGADEVRTALAKLDSLTTVRGSVDNRHADATTTFQFYTTAIGALNGIKLGLDQAQDGALRHGLQALYALADAKEYTGQERGLLNGVFASNTLTPSNYRTFARILGAKQASLAEYDTYATAAERAAVDNVLNSPRAGQANDLEAIAVQGASGTLSTKVDPEIWWSSMTSVIDGMREVQLSVGQDVMTRATALRDQAGVMLGSISLLAVLIIGIMIALVIGAARSVIDPVRLLARDADDMSVRRLPRAVAKLQTEEGTDLAEPVVNLVPADAATEIAVLARALDRLQDTALTLATEQALIRRNTTASLANLGRRNQNLVRRQLALISDFEREELDPSALANMFELDHLATRMRRNAESVLVLVGQTSPRVWSQPLPIADVIRAALSEVEDYRRVVLRRVDPAFVAGSVITDVAHMVAELVENGLAFSPPELEVEIYGRKMGNRYLLVVVDHGVGMSPAELARAQARLRDEENFLIAPARFLGHYVVGRLANRLKIRVDLSESPVTGLTARLLLPADLLADDDNPTVITPVAKENTQQTGARRSGAATNGAARTIRTTTQTQSAPIPVARSASQAPATPPPVRTTPNGLVKRQSRRRAVEAAATPVPPAPRVAERPAATEAATERTPSEVRSMLSAFQQGHQRGQLAVSGVANTAGDVPARVAREEEPGEH